MYMKNFCLVSPRCYLPVSITEDFRVFYFPDANVNLGMMSTAGPETHIQVEGDFR